MRNRVCAHHQGVGVRGRGLQKGRRPVENFVGFALVLPCAVPCDFDGDGLISNQDLRRLLRRCGIRNIQGGYTRILQGVPRVSPVTIVGWSLAAQCDGRIAQPERYVAAVLQHAPWQRDVVPEPFRQLAAQPPEVWTLFAEHTWLQRYLGQGEAVPVPAELRSLYAQWRAVYDDCSTADLPFDLGQTAVQHIRVWQAVIYARAESRLQV